MVAWLYYQPFYKLDIVLERKIDSDDQRVENAINHVTETILNLLNSVYFLKKIITYGTFTRPLEIIKRHLFD